MKRSKLVWKRKEISALDKDLKMDIRDDAMYIKNFKFEWDENNGLTTGEEEGNKKLSALIGRDVEELVCKVRQNENRNQRTSQPSTTHQ